MLYGFLFYGLLSLLNTVPASPASTGNADVFLSQDEGGSWSNFGSGLPEEAFAQEALMHQGELFLITDRFGIYKRKDQTGEWQPTNVGLPIKINLRSIAATKNTLAVGSFKQGLYLSRNNGKSWQKPFSNLNAGSIRALLFCEGKLFAGTDNGVYISTPAATFWQHTGDLRQVNDLLHYQGQVYAARQDGLVRSKDGGKTWEQLLTDRTVSKVTVAEGALYVHLLGQKDLLRSLDGGVTWEKGIKAWNVCRSPSLTKALWTGYEPKLPDGSRLFHVAETPFGWIASKVGGC